MKIPLEDLFADVVGKAQRGLKLDDDALAGKAGLSPEALSRLKAAPALTAADEPAVGRLAAALGLRATALSALGRSAWYPAATPPADHFAAFNTPCGGDMTVNAYLVWDPDTGAAALFDTGTNPGPILRVLTTRQLKLTTIFLTHTHSDHVAALADLTADHAPAVHVSELEPLPGAQPFAEGQSFAVGGLRVTTRLTRGHTVGGTTFVVEGRALPVRVAVVGDALFAGSQGGVGPELYPEALRRNREQIFSLPDATLLCPGHGPLTTVGEERAHNPFYP